MSNSFYKLTAAVLALVLSVFQPALVMAQSGGNCSVFRSWI